MDTMDNHDRERTSQVRPMGKKRKQAMRAVLHHSDRVLRHTLPFLDSRDITIKAVPPAHRNRYFSVLTDDAQQLSFLARNFLCGNLMLDDLTKNPQAILQQLEAYYAISNDRKYYGMAVELCGWLAGRSKKMDALQFYLAALYYSRKMLFEDVQADQKEQISDLFALEVPQLLRIYNLACVAVFRYLKERQLLHSSGFTLSGIAGRKCYFQEPQFRLSVPEEQVAEYTLCADYEVTGLRQMNRVRGVGVPLVGWLTENSPLHSLRTPPGMTIPVTLRLQLRCRPDGMLEIFPIYQDVTLQESMQAEHALNGIMRFPLALDFSTPLACFQNLLPARNTLLLMLDPRTEEHSTGLYMIEPYNPAKIPVVCVHGLMSTPGTWMEMINTLKNDPLIRKRYQFWFFSYSSGAPILLSVYKLNRALLAAQQELCITPEARQNFEKMVILGHSMGGLMTHFLLRREQNYFPNALLREPWEIFRERLTPEVRKEIEDLACFPAVPFIRRAVFLATPHRGAKMARMAIARLGVKLIELPQEVKEHAKAFLELYRQYGKYPEALNTLRNQFFTGIDNLDPTSLLIRALSKCELRTDVKFHAVIGNRRGADCPGGSDGVVPYASSHWNDVESERIVQSGHNVQKHPAAMQEVLRILLLHLKEMDTE